MRWPPSFCPDCGARLELEAGAFAVAPLQIQCSACAEVHYRNAKPCAGLLIERDGKVLLARRARAPRKGTWDIVGGFLEPHEHPEDGALREALEETGLRPRLDGLLGIYIDRYVDSVDADAQEMGDFTMNVYYLAHSDSGEPRPADDVDKLSWFGPDSLKTLELAFPHEERVLSDWIRRRNERGDQ
jgi:ADP-ribose pyrophosphatase YjhB (NUDIX family)